MHYLLQMNERIYIGHAVNQTDSFAIFVEPNALNQSTVLLLILSHIIQLISCAFANIFLAQPPLDGRHVKIFRKRFRNFVK